MLSSLSVITFYSFNIIGILKKLLINIYRQGILGAARQTQQK